MKVAAFLDIPKLRIPQGISQAELSVKSGINRYRLSQLECGYSQPTDSEKAALLAAMLAIVKEKTAASYAALQEIK